MDIQLNEKVAQNAKELANKVKQLASDAGMSESEVVCKILEWYFRDCESEK